MRIIHRISVGNLTSREEAAFHRLQFEFARGTAGLFIADEDPRWPAAKLLAKEQRLVVLSHTEFSHDELSRSRATCLVPTWHWDYPMTDDDNGYLNLTFDLTDYCSKCGMGKRQKAPFRLRGEPRWGRRTILQLNWVFDVYFVTPQVWSHVFKPHGIECIPAVKHRTGEELQTVVQLDVREDVPVDVSGLPYEECLKCGRRKYLPFTEGFYPKPDETSLPAFRSTQEFGSGGSAFRQFMVSQAVYQSMLAARVRGCEYKACMQ